MVKKKTRKNSKKKTFHKKEVAKKNPDKKIVHKKHSAKKGLPKKYAKMGFKKGWQVYKKAKKAMAEKRASEKKPVKKTIHKKTSQKKPIEKNSPSLQFKSEQEIAMDFATKVYQKFNKLIKSIVLFGSVAKQMNQAGSDIDIIIVIDDIAINWDEELIAWYRTELDKILRANPYSKDLHINTVKLSTWWGDLMKGDPTVINVLRYGEAMIDFAGFFEPLKYLLIKGKIRATPEAIHDCLQRAPIHYARSKAAELGSIEGLYWAMVDSAHAALISANVLPPSPEFIPKELKETFVDTGRLKMKYVVWYRDLLALHKKIVHGEISDLKGVEIDEWQARTKDFLETMIKIVDDLVSGTSPQ
ncbi:MAG: nucleotidyltransferase domain-containing protein [Candidatus Pacearchaeota archaeon]|jgi:predicted nucleotidyltransferase